MPNARQVHLAAAAGQQRAMLAAAVPTRMLAGHARSAGLQIKLYAAYSSCGQNSRSAVEHHLKSAHRNT